MSVTTPTGFRAHGVPAGLKASGGKVKIDEKNQHVWKTVRIGKVRADGQFDEVWNSGQPVQPDPYLEGYDWAKDLKKGR